MLKRIALMFILACSLALIPACGGGDKDHKDHSHKDHDHKDHGHKDHDDHDDDEGHVHAAPRGGTLVELGDHEANVELVLDAERKLFTLYVLDAHAENAAKIAQPTVEITIHAAKLKNQDKPLADFTIELAAIANENTGEKVGSTSQFEIAQEGLQGLTTFEGTIRKLEVKGSTFENIKFKFAPATSNLK